jgi:hypothetical protein
LLVAGHIQGFGHELNLFDLLWAATGVQLPPQQAADFHPAHIGEFAAISTIHKQGSLSGCFPADHQHHRKGLLGPGVNPAGIFDAEYLAAIVAAAQVGGAGLEL